jgi:hypothetical protein
MMSESSGGFSRSVGSMLLHNTIRNMTWRQRQAAAPAGFCGDSDTALPLGGCLTASWG